MNVDKRTHGLGLSGIEATATKRRVKLSSHDIKIRKKKKSEVEVKRLTEKYLTPEDKKGL